MKVIHLGTTVTVALGLLDEAGDVAEVRRVPMESRRLSHEAFDVMADDALAARDAWQHEVDEARDAASD